MQCIQVKMNSPSQGHSFGLNIGVAFEILVRQNGVIFGKIWFYCIFCDNFKILVRQRQPPSCRTWSYAIAPSVFGTFNDYIGHPCISTTYEFSCYIFVEFNSYYKHIGKFLHFCETRFWQIWLEHENSSSPPIKLIMSSFKNCALFLFVIKNFQFLNIENWHAVLSLFAR